MCRWLAYTGSPILLSKALYAPAHSLIDQSLHARLGAEATNGDGFGIGWYDDTPGPGVFRSIEPAWNDRNLHELSDHIRSAHFFAHVRAARSAQRCSRPTATPSDAGPGSGCTTGSSPTSRQSSEI